ncbi:MAG: DUF533 domain-containing protein [Verrucomicrobiae bacterium]|nr:DUF533 domain-containing protein [Verrucomicrobiae bacterium]
MSTHLSSDLHPNEQEALLTVCLMAAFADGAKSDVERAELKRIAETFAETEMNLAALYRRVLMRQVTIAQAVQPLATLAARQLAYEMAVCVCDADDTLNDAERQFLAELRRELRLDTSEAATLEQQPGALAGEPLEAMAAPPVIGAQPAAPSAPGVTPDAVVEKMILNYAILAAALELLPDSLATLAIVPLQMKMVYRVGKHYGYTLDRGHIKELLGVVGVGLTSQVVEGYARKLVGGVLGRVGGGLLRSVGRQVAGSAMSFATTWALGRVAQQYYAGGRKLSAIELRQLFGSLTEQARGLHTRYAGEIQQQAARVNPAQLLSLIRSQ